MARKDTSTSQARRREASERHPFSEGLAASEKKDLGLPPADPVAAQISFELAKLGSCGPGIPFSTSAGFAEALGSLGGEAMLLEVTVPEEDEEPEFEDGMSRASIGHIARGQGWNAALEHIRRSKEWIYLHGDCWHFALALHRLYGLELVAVEVSSPHGDEDDADERKHPVHHVAAVLPDGRYLDIRGFLDGEAAMRRGMMGWQESAVRPSSRDEVLEILDRFSASCGFDPFLWDDPKAYPFAEQTETLIRILFEEEIEQALAHAARLP